jgi:hypothetical protein
MKNMKNKSNWIRCAVVAVLAVSGSLFAAAPAYQVERSFGQDEIKVEPKGIVMGAGDQLHVLLGNGTVVTYDAGGKTTGSFASEMTPAPGAITVADGKLYLLQTKKIEKEMEYQGKKIKRLIPDGVVCGVFDLAGKKISEFNLPEVQSATSAHFIGKELVVADIAKSQILYFDVSGSEAKVTQKITKQFRLCCGIFDFCPGTTPDSLVVANLGAFKVQTFTAGAKTAEFGQRGTKFDEFQGCCNPVNVACLSDGSIITVEKDPTRVKIYDKDGKSCTSVKGLGELVNGCYFIPTAIDSHGAVYLASAQKKCIVKCVPAK